MVPAHTDPAVIFSRSPLPDLRSELKLHVLLGEGNSEKYEPDLWKLQISQWFGVLFLDWRILRIWVCQSIWESCANWKHLCIVHTGSLHLTFASSASLLWQETYAISLRAATGSQLLSHPWWPVQMYMCPWCQTTGPCASCVSLCCWFWLGF